MTRLDWLFGLMICLALYAIDVQVERDVENARGLPHRPVDQLTNWGQGRQAPTNDCPPGTVRYETDTGFFLECYRGTN